MYTQCQMRNYVTKHLWHLTHENSSENVHKTSKLSCMMLQSIRWQFRQVVFSLNMVEIEKCEDIWRPKTWHSLIHIDCPSSRWKIIMISVIFLRGQTCETKKKRFWNFWDVENVRNILLCNNRFMVLKYAASTLKWKLVTFDLLKIALGKTIGNWNVFKLIQF